jgi:D-alanine-D-alanine ligase
LKIDELGDLAPPLIVKPNFEGSSKGVRLARDRAQLAAAVTTIAGRYPRGVLVEEYVEGIDVAVGWFAGHGQLPPIWYRHDAAIYDYALKHETPERVRVEVPELEPVTERRLQVAATRAFEALGVTGYGRADFRITPDGEVVFLELNPLPSLTLATGHDELYVAAAHAGLSPRELLGLIVTSAVREQAITRVA